MDPVVVDVLGWAWFLFVTWAAVHEWHETHPSKLGRHHRHRHS
ncbi:MAG: hypothetical protein ACR2F6_08605 [Mycobacteriales bacterium]